MLPAAQGVYPTEAAQRREKLIKSYQRDGIDIDIAYQPEVSGFQPWGGSKDPSHWKFAARVHELGGQVAKQAEIDGYDAFCPFGLVDVGIDDARRLGVTIPVVGPAEASALICGMLGRRFARCRYVSKPSSEERERARIERWGLTNLFAGDTAIGIANSEYPQRRNEVLEQFLRCADEARAMGAEMMGMVGMSICPVEFSARELSEATGLPVLDGIAAQIAIAQLWHLTGLEPTLLKLPRS
jgi:Asp/Glu/hydantoin racemase